MILRLETKMLINAVLRIDADLFYKPIRKTTLNNILVSNRRVILTRMMMIYDKLFHVIETEGSSPVNVIQDPIGLITVPMINTIQAKEIREAVLKSSLITEMVLFIIMIMIRV